MNGIPYITTRRARFKALCGQVNVPRGTPVEASAGFLELNGQRLCTVTSQNAHDYFARNDDGDGLERGALTAAIIGRLSKRDGGYQARWDKVWADALCKKYRRAECDDHWMWGHGFFEANVEELRYIWALVKDGK